MSNLAENDAANLPKIANNKVAPAPQMAQVAVVIPLSHKLKVKSTSLAHVLMLDPESGIFPEYFFVPKHFDIDNKQSHLHVRKIFKVVCKVEENKNRVIHLELLIICYFHFRCFPERIQSEHIRKNISLYRETE